MQIRDKSIVITGAASGIGRAMATRFAAEGARGLTIGDVDAEGLAKVAADSGASWLTTDVTREEDVVALIEQAESEFGGIDLLVSNAGIAIKGGVEVGNDEWAHILQVNLMAHIYAARAALPGMIARGGGYLLQTASAAGLLTQIGSAPYAVTKHAAVALAEWLAITHGHQGIKVSVLCPQAVRTAMTQEDEGGVASIDGMLEPEDVCDSVMAGLDSEQFLILPHPEVVTYMQRKTNDYDRWIRGMRRLQDQFQEQ